MVGYRCASQARGATVKELCEVIWRVECAGAWQARLQRLAASSALIRSSNMARPRAGIVYVGLKASVVALDRRTGAEVWRTPLKGGVGRSSSFVTLQRDGDILYAGVGGEIWALDPKSGTILWHNPLKGFGYGIASILGDTEDARSSALPGASAENQRQAAAAAAASA
jgi:outer membrane protein assembly factor BamB